MDGTGTAAQYFRNIPGHFHPGHILAGVHFFRGRSKQNVCAHFLRQLAVVFQGAGIGVQIFRRSELGRIYKVAYNSKIIFRVGRFDEGSMPFMQGAHSGNQTDSFSGFFCFFNDCLQFCYSFY